MNIWIELSMDEQTALNRYIYEYAIDSAELAAKLGLREFLISAGYIEMPRDGAHNETKPITNMLEGAPGR